MVTSVTEKQLHSELKKVLDNLKVECQYPDFIGVGHKAHVTAREGVHFAEGHTQTAHQVHLVEVVDKKRICHLKAERSPSDPRFSKITDIREQ